MKDYNSKRIGGQSVFGQEPVILSGLQRFSVLILLSLAAACSVNNPKLTGLAGLESDAALVSNSVAKPVEIAGVASTDAEIIKSTVVTAAVNSNSSVALAWANPATGSSGTIMAIDKFLGKHGQRCRGFKTTVNTFMGITFYNGEACQISPTEWVLSWFRQS